MARTCTVCTHPDVDGINRRLMSGDSYRDIAGHFGTSKSALERHHKGGHIPKAMAKAEEAQTVARADNLLAELQAVRKRSEELLVKAEKMGEARSWPAFLRVMTDQIKLLAELEGRLAAQAQVNIIIDNPAWVELRTLIVEAVEPYPEARRAIINAIRQYDTGV